MNRSAAFSRVSGILGGELPCDRSRRRHLDHRIEAEPDQCGRRHAGALAQRDDRLDDVVGDRRGDQQSDPAGEHHRAASGPVRSSAAGVGFCGRAAGRVDGENKADEIAECVPDSRRRPADSDYACLRGRRRPGRSRADRPGGWTGSACSPRSGRPARTDSPAHRATSRGSRRGWDRTTRIRIATARRCGSPSAFPIQYSAVCIQNRLNYVGTRDQMRPSIRRSGCTQLGDRRSLKDRNPSTASSPL